MPHEDVAQIIGYGQWIAGKELKSGLEVTELQDKMERDRERARTSCCSALPSSK
jgi:hypothetical protein